MHTIEADLHIRGADHLLHQRVRAIFDLKEGIFDEQTWRINSGRIGKF
jgi:hypothetical protein